MSMEWLMMKEVGWLMMAMALFAYAAAGVEWIPEQGRMEVKTKKHKALFKGML